MLRQLSSEVRDCYARAEDCARSAANATTNKARDDFLRLERHWLTLARSYQLLEQLGLFDAHGDRQRAKFAQALEELNEFFKNGKSKGGTGAKSSLSAHNAKVAAKDASSTRLVEVCATAGVELLRYPVPADRQVPGQTMAVGTISRCLSRYGNDTLITALQCVTQTTNNKPGVLTARVIKALCALLAADPMLRDSGLALFEKFDRIDLIALSKKATDDAAAQEIDRVEALIACVRRALDAEIAGAGPSVKPNDSLDALAKIA